MADAVSTLTLSNGPRNLIRRFTNLSDGTGEAAVKKIDAADVTLGNRGVALGVYSRIRRIEYIIRSGGVALYWEATANQPLAVLNGEGCMDFRPGAKMPTPGAAGATGSILLTTVGFMINSGYDITIHLIKGVPQT